MFHSFNSDWTAQNLGQIFGITLDDSVPPNIYVAASSTYGIWFTSSGAFALGMYGPLKAGGVYQIDGTTGQVCNYAQLPNSGPALGNIAYDRVHQQFFVSNLENGVIYRIPKISKPCSSLVPAVSTFDHGLNRHVSSSALPPLADDGLTVNPQSPNTQSGFTHGAGGSGASRCSTASFYYSVWNTDERGPVPGESTHNEIWSVALLPNGDFDTSTVTLEQTVPFLNNRTYSNPVSDIAFSSKNRMLLAERVHYLDYGVIKGTIPGNPPPFDAHFARNLEYDLSAPIGSPPKTIYVGDVDFYPDFPHANSAGGIDYGTATAVGIGASAKLASPGLLGKLGLLFGGAGLGAAGGITGVLLGVRPYFNKARDDRERQGLRVYVVLGIALVLAATLGMLSSTHSRWGMGASVLGLYLGLIALIFGWLPRVTARRMSAEIAEDPEAWRRQRRERRRQILGALGALLVGGAVAVWAILQAGS